MGFDADAWRAASQVWVYREDGREYPAREVSAPAVVAAQMELQGASAMQERKILLGLLRLAYPWRVSMWWLGDPVQKINALPPEAWRDVIRSFFAFVTGNPVTTMTVLGPSLPISSSSAVPILAEDSPPTP